MSTPDNKVAEAIWDALEQRRSRLNAERAMLVRADDRIGEIDAELAILATEKERIEPRRPPREPLVDSRPEARVRSET